MNRRDVAVLAFKLFGFFLVLSIIRWIEYVGTNWPELYSAYSNTDRSFRTVSMFVFPLVSLAIVVGAGVLIWRNSDKLAEYVFPVTQPTERIPSPDPIRRQDILRLALALIGLWLIAGALPGIISEAFARLVLPSQEFSGSTQDYYTLLMQVGLIRMGLEVVLGTVLLFWRPLSRFLRGVLLFEAEQPVPLPVQETSERILCPYCKNPVAQEQTAACPGCGALYHEACWNEHGACAIFGCSNSSGR